MKCFFLLFTVIIAIVSCLNKKIEITPEYIINPNWSKQSEKAGANTIEIKRMKVKADSTIKPLAELSQDEILNKLEPDSSFAFFANVKIKPEESYNSKKIYFTRENDFYWLKDKYGTVKTKIIGRLSANTWYTISKIEYFSYVLFIDSSDKVHCYIINQANY